MGCRQDEVVSLINELVVATQDIADPWSNFGSTFLAGLLATIAGAGAAFGAAALLRHWDREDERKGVTDRLERERTAELDDRIGSIVMALSRLATAISGRAPATLDSGISARDSVLHLIRTSQMLAKDDELAALEAVYRDVAARSWPSGREVKHAESIVATLVDWRRGKIKSADVAAKLTDS